MTQKNSRRPGHAQGFDFVTKRVYLPAAASDGQRILVDRLWPRGLSKADAKIDHWFRELAPSTELRRWFGHDPARWDGFRRRYRAELEAQADQIEALVAALQPGRVTLLYGAKEERYNNAVALKDYLVDG